MTSNGGGYVIQQSQPAGLFGKRTRTRTTVVVPLAQPVCPPCDDDDDDAQREILRSIVDRLRDSEEENRDLLLLLIQMLRDNEEITIPIQLPSPELPIGTSSIKTRRSVYYKTSSGWRKSYR